MKLNAEQCYIEIADDCLAERYFIVFFGSAK